MNTGMDTGSVVINFHTVPVDPEETAVFPFTVTYSKLRRGKSI